MVITYIMSGYETHKFHNSLIANIYTCTPPDSPTDSSSSSNNRSPTRKDLSKRDFKRTVSSNEKFKYSYCESLWAWLLTSCCCCCLKTSNHYRRYARRQKLYQEANQRLSKELNLYNLLHTVRMTDFIADILKLKTHQKLLVSK